MLGRRPQPGLFTATNLFGEKLTGLGFYGLIALEGRQLFNDWQFRGVYAKTGRPSGSPALMALARLLQCYEGISDAVMIERLKYDLRWKAALDLDPMSMVPPFSRPAYVRWRARLTLHEKEGVAFERSVHRAREAGLLPKKLCVALDSSPVRGRGALKDTYNLLSDGVCKAVRAIAKAEGTSPRAVATRLGVERHFEPSIKGTEAVDWSSEAAKNEFLSGLVNDCERVVEEARSQGCAGQETALLRELIAQDVDETDGEHSIRQGVAKGRVVSVHDPEIRHGRKTSGKTYNGHKVHVAVEETSGVVVAVDAGAPGEADGAFVGELIEEAERTTERPVVAALGDAAYGSRRATAAAESRGVDLLTKMPSSPKGRFGPGDFKVSRNLKTAHCPAGHASEKAYRRNKGYKHYWATELCSICPLRDRCTKAKARILTVEPDFHDRRRRERRAKSKRGRRRLKRRTVVEHAIGRAKNMGAGAARYFGQAKTKAQWQWTCAVLNLQRVWSALTAPQVAGVAA